MTTPPNIEQARRWVRVKKSSDHYAPHARRGGARFPDPRTRTRTEDELLEQEIRRIRAQEWDNVLACLDALTRIREENERLRERLKQEQP